MRYAANSFGLSLRLSASLGPQHGLASNKIVQKNSVLLSPARAPFTRLGHRLAIYRPACASSRRSTAYEGDFDSLGNSTSYVWGTAPGIRVTNAHPIFNQPTTSRSSLDRRSRASSLPNEALRAIFFACLPVYIGALSTDAHC